MYPDKARGAGTSTTTLCEPEHRTICLLLRKNYWNIVTLIDVWVSQRLLMRYVHFYGHYHVVQDCYIDDGRFSQ